jgi:hypothetical protein
MVSVEVPSFATTSNVPRGDERVPRMMDWPLSQVVSLSVNGGPVAL